jgi:uncharacterized protein YihD (DUF1040 family)
VRDPARIKRIIDKLHAAWIKQEDSRLTQLISNLHRDKPYSLFYVEDDETEKALDVLLMVQR